MRRVPRRVGAGLAVVIAIAAVIGIVLAVDSPSPSGGATNGSQNSGATTVQRRNLVETDTESGTLSYAEPQTVYNRLSGTVTWLPSVGQVIKPGDALYRVSGDPVILMNGSTPAYRDLSAADSAGPDILELNRNLVRLGFNPDGIVVDDVWQPATTDAVEVFQESLGQTATGILTLGQVVFLPGNQVVSALETSVGSTGGGSGSPSNSSAADLSPTGSSPEFVSLTKTTPTPTARPRAHSPAKPKKPKAPTTLSALLALLRAETAELRAAQAQLRAAQAASHSSNNRHNSNGNGSHPSGSGSANHSHSPGGSGGTGSGGTGSGGSGGSPSGGGSASAILQTSSTHLVATVDLDASKQSEAKVGERVTVEMPSGNTVDGTITAVSSVATPSSNSGNGNGNGSGNGGGGNGNGGNGSSTPTIPVTISLRGHIAGPGLDQAAVSVNFAEAEANNVLSVPVTALLAISGGRYAVQDAAAPHKIIPVTTGLFAAGFVQISGPGVYPGLQVTDSQG